MASTITSSSSGHDNSILPVHISINASTYYHQKNLKPYTYTYSEDNIFLSSHTHYSDSTYDPHSIRTNNLTVTTNATNTSTNRSIPEKQKYKLKRTVTEYVQK